jgi:hypothetical protein
MPHSRAKRIKTNFNTRERKIKMEEKKGGLGLRATAHLQLKLIFRIFPPQVVCNPDYHTNRISMHSKE